MKISRLNLIRHTRNMQDMRHFYGNLLGLAILESWDHADDNCGSIYSLGLDGQAGTIEVLSLGDAAIPGLSPANVDVGIHVDDVQAWHDFLVKRGLPIARGLKTDDWGPISFGVDDPEGLRLWFIEWPDQK